MLGVLKDIVHLRRHQIGVLAEDFGPVEIGESLGEFLRARRIFDPQEGVLPLGVADPVGGQFSRQPFVAVHINLDGAWETMFEPGRGIKPK